MPDLLIFLQAGSAAFLTVLLGIALSNLWAMRRLASYRTPPREFPRVSLLVPARNEAGVIAACVTSLLNQDYPNFEVLVLDDQSTDDTAAVLEALAQYAPRLRLLRGRPLPEGWLGKHWACQQLAEAAEGTLWLFIDADTRHHPRMLAEAVAALEQEQADLLSALPRQVTPTWGEQVTVPLLSWSLFTFFPLALAHRLQWPPLVMAVGQWMLFRASTYRRIGGHAAVRAHVADDIALARHLVRAGGRWRLLEAGDRVTCRMYTSLSTAFDGFSKNLFAAFGYNASWFAFVWSWLGLVFLLPYGRLIAAPGWAVASIALSSLLWLIAALRLRLPVHTAITYPVCISVALVVAVRSLWLTRTGRATWKGRRLTLPPPT